MTYDVDYFIRKFEAIPEEDMIVGPYGSGPKGCAVFQCDGLEEFWALRDMFAENLNCCASSVNDGNEDRFPQPTPKQRILAALREVKEKGL